MENFIPLLTRLIKNPEFKLVKEKFIIPKRDEDTGMFKFDSSNQFYQNLNLPKIYCMFVIKLDNNKLGKRLSKLF